MGKRCKNCGACQECGAPVYPQPVRPWPVSPWPFYPGTYPVSPYWSVTPPYVAPTVTYCDSTPRASGYGHNAINGATNVSSSTTMTYVNFKTDGPDETGALAPLH